MLDLLIVGTVCLLGAQLALCEPLSFNEVNLPCHRLPVNVRPTSYEVHLKFPSLDSNYYEGQVKIGVHFGASKPNGKVSRQEADIAKSVRSSDCSFDDAYNRIVLHADERLDIKDIKVRSEAHLNFLFNGKSKKREISKLLRDRKKQMISISLKRWLVPNTTGQITISFEGQMRDDKRGLYVSTHKDGQKVYKHIVSQFQPTDARTVFPCFDEPRFKVPFSVKLSHPQNLVAYGNTEVKSVVTDDVNSLETTTFLETPKMPIHMVAFTVGQFDRPLEVISENTIKGVPSTPKVRIITVPGKRHMAFFALEVANRSLGWFERYIDFKFPLDKLDVIAIADHDKDNTESWGLVFVRDNLLWIDYETKPDTKITTAVNVAHVVVHQWFANLVSAAWWTDLWITEGVAAQFSFRIVRDLFEPKVEYFLRLATLSSVMQADQAGTMHSLSPKFLRTSDQIYDIFDNLEFMKSASLAEMVSDAVGGSWYQNTLRRLVADHAYGSIDFSDYVHALTNNCQQDHGKIIEVIRSFIAYKGVPLLNVAQSALPKNSIELSLESFNQDKRLTADKVEHREQDLTIFTSVSMSGASLKQYPHNGPNSRIFPPLVNQLVGEGLVQVTEYPTLATYYRVRYTDDLYRRLSKAIKKKNVMPMARLQILDDANNLVQAQLIKNDTYRNLLESYANEFDAAVVIALHAATKTLSGLITSDPTRSQSNSAFLNYFTWYGFKVTGVDESLIMQRARQVTLTALIKQGNQEVIEAALKAYEEARGDVALFLREPVYTAIVLSGSVDQVGDLIYRLERTKSYEEKMRLMAALSLSSDKHVLGQLQTWLDSSDLKQETLAPYLKIVAEKLSQ